VGVAVRVDVPVGVTVSVSVAVGVTTNKLPTLTYPPHPTL
jgi:hypothetical protein